MKEGESALWLSDTVQTGFGRCADSEVLEGGLGMVGMGGTFLSHCCCSAQPVERAEHRGPVKPARGDKLLWL